jgi:hypothetical protein
VKLLSSLAVPTGIAKEVSMVDAASQKRSGLSVALDTIVAPQAAFAALRERAHWGWAYLIVCVLGAIGAVLQIPAGEHVVVATFTQNPTNDPNIAAMSPDKLQQVIGFSKAVQHYTWLFYPVIAIVAILVASVVLLVANAAGGGKANFARLFGLAANVALVNYGIYYVVLGALAALRGPDAFNSQRDLLTLVPSLAWFAAGASAKVTAVLAGFNPFSIWSFVLLGLGLRGVADVKPAVAWSAAAALAFGSALIGAAAVR